MNSETAAWSGRRPALRASNTSSPTFPAPPAWTERSLCAQIDTEIFFPEKGGRVTDAKKICALCEVAPDCLAYALANNERHGIWGGVSERDRRGMSGAA